jgi:hypothetical protein
MTREQERENKMTVLAERKQFQTVADLIAVLESFSAVIRLDEMYVQDFEGRELDTVELVQETLSDGSVVFNVNLSSEGDPNS